jgi:general secretion pathway protein A
VAGPPTPAPASGPAATAGGGRAPSGGVAPGVALAPSGAAARPTPDLATLLAAAPPASGPAHALVRVLARWGVTVAPDEDPCRVAVRHGLECYDGRGTWTVVRRLGVPVVVKLITADGARHHAAVTALDGDTATLYIGDRAELLPVGAVERLWDGVFSTIWRPLPGVARVLGPGMQGPGVAWLRRALGDGDIGGRDRGPAVYDEALAARVVAFQRREGLEADGMAGIETLVRVSTRLDARAPRLSSGPTAR